jgi:hypothetical protein
MGKVAYPLRVAKTQDEDGKDRFFVEDANADWISDALDTWEQADAELKAITEEDEASA